MDQWIYINGELYHAGVKGMQWGKHLPGTDWWKESVNSYYKNNNIGYNSGGRVKDVDEKGRTTFRDANPTYGNNANFIQRAKANLYTAGKAAKIYGRKANLAGRILTKQAGAKIRKGAYRIAKGTSKLWNSAKGYSADTINKLKEDARKSYESVRGLVNDVMRNYFKSGSSNYSKNFISGSDNLIFLRNYVTKEYNDSVMAYTKAKRNGSFSNNVNSFIQTAQYNIVSGCARFLDAIGMDKATSSFLKKIGIKAYK